MITEKCCYKYPAVKFSCFSFSFSDTYTVQNLTDEGGCLYKKKKKTAKSYGQ